jgi:hypothetical protein
MGWKKIHMAKLLDKGIPSINSGTIKRSKELYSASIAITPQNRSAKFEVMT